jgi:hypothetical protein
MCFSTLRRTINCDIYIANSTHIIHTLSASSKAPNRNVTVNIV